MTTGDKVNRLAVIKRQTANNGKRITKLVTKQNELLAESTQLFNSLSSADKKLFSEKLTKYGYPV